jgi:hypothetical protein
MGPEIIRKSVLEIEHPKSVMLISYDNSCFIEMQNKWFMQLLLCVQIHDCVAMFPHRR